MFTGGNTHLLAEHLASSAVVVYTVYCTAVLFTGGDTHLLAEHLAASAVVVYTVYCTAVLCTGGDTHLLAENLAASAVVVYTVYCTDVCVQAGILISLLSTWLPLLLLRTLSTVQLFVYRRGYSSPC